LNPEGKKRADEKTKNICEYVQKNNFLIS